MKNKKTVLILIIVILTIILAVGGVTFAYTTTDFLKTNKQLFSKYMDQSLEKFQNFKSQKLTTYLDKIETTPYESEGKLSASVEVPETLKRTYPALDRANSVNITFLGKNDKLNKKSEQAISINYSDDVSFPIEYKQNGNLCGLTSNILINTYLTVRNDELNELLGKFGVSENLSIMLPNSSKSNQAEIKNALEKSKTIIIENLTEDNFSKIDTNTFALTLNKEETANIIGKISQELENVGLIQNVSKEDIEKAINAIKTENNATNEFLKIIVKKDGNITISIAKTTLGIQITDNKITVTLINSESENNAEITIEKLENENQLTYKIEYSMLDAEIKSGAFFEAQYSDLTSQNVKENYIFGIKIDNDGEKIAYEYDFDISKKFVDNIEIQELTENNSVVLSDASNEYIAALIVALKGKISEINSSQMQALGIQENENPLIYATPLGYTLYQMNNIINNVGEKVEEVSVEVFNAQFLSYEGIQKGASIKSLVRVVNKSNESNTLHTVSINGMSEATELDNYASGINTAQDYNVVINKDEETGYVKSINII